MQSIKLLSVACLLAGMIFCHPVLDDVNKAVEAGSERLISTGLTEDGVPYNLTRGMRKITDSRGSGGGTSGNCNQWYSDKYCYCSGAISNRGDCYHGSMDHCNANVIDRGRAGIYGHGESYTIKWMPTLKIEYKITNFCGWTYEVTMGMCGTPFLDLIDWCQWTWEAHKGGKYKLNDCIQYSFDVNAR